MGKGLSSGINMMRQQTPKPALTREHIVWAYRLLLDREPENEDIVEQWVRWSTTTSVLRQEFMRSTEFQRLNADTSAYTLDSKPAIALLQDGLRLFVDLADYGLGVQIMRGVYERNEHQFICDSVKPGQRVLDIGANIGLYSMVCARLVGPAGHVHAYEPLAPNLDLFERSMRENHFEERITLTRAAVGRAVGSEQIVWRPVGRDNFTSGGAYLQAAGQPVPPDHRLESVPVISIDSQGLPAPVHFIKIDIEGAELLAFEGARDTLLRDHPTILSEMYPGQLRKVSGVSPTELIEFMKSLGYSCRMLAEAPNGEILRSFPESGPIISVVFSAD